MSVPELVLLASVPLLITTSLGLADNWPAWRGPAGNGVSPEARLPLRWSANQNVRWRVPLPERGNSTPIVWGDRVFLTQAEGTRRTLMCFAVDDGRLLWQAGPTWNESEITHEENPPCSSSPVTDGRCVIAWFGSAGVFCYNVRGRELWRRDLGRQSHQWGYAASPVLHGDLCLVHFGPGERSFLVALDKRTGQTRWQHDLPRIPAGARWEELGGETRSAAAGSGTVAEAAGSWATPIVVRSLAGPAAVLGDHPPFSLTDPAGTLSPARGAAESRAERVGSTRSGARAELILTCPLRVIALAPMTGQLLWTCDGPNIGIYSSPFFGEGIVGVAANGFTNIVMALRPGGHGDVSATHRLWRRSPPNSQACIGSGVIHGGHLYQMTYMGFAQCLDLKTGHTVWEQRMTGSGARNASWSSPVLAGDRLYVPNQNADVFVLRADAKFECLATNSTGGERMNASLATSNGAIYLRTHAHLWCLAEAKSR